MKLVRRARKSIRERRMKECINDLNSNLSKVEMRVFKKQKKERDTKRVALGLAQPVPKNILMGRMNPELYAIECRLHKEAGLSKPLPYQGYKQDLVRSHATTQCVGFVGFRTILQAIRARNNQSMNDV
ncbi:hypothetical protein ABB37_07052 [Leptomonas pyrrhocoris]|uniref:Uncharacterized protein n=1 Tax=Leptomonas pyrrhocoris TaxID=157538 RepID=A0A0M9FX23_LEPPY|nr:hypothetical protein ABB37_07052 [Leptomonas pyrrhocoris]KPA77733.1 hypothetical protein ABB37_07052 [Leptomonas pyrrhocoris]|eukprot:XP_015656172.1 hypothetical protein ABB37_07052 [Leptomonas pyrrhocoris]